MSVVTTGRNQDEILADVRDIISVYRIKWERFLATSRVRVKDAGLWREWTAALRSGDYDQGFGHLRPRSGGYCCWGVLCEKAALSHGETSGGNWSFNFDTEDESFSEEQNPDIRLINYSSFPPPRWLMRVFTGNEENMRELRNLLAVANDSQVVPFALIASWVAEIPLLEP